MPRMTQSKNFLLPAYNSRSYKYYRERRFTREQIGYAVANKLIDTTRKQISMYRLMPVAIP